MGHAPGDAAQPCCVELYSKVLSPGNSGERGRLLPLKARMRRSLKHRPAGDAQTAEGRLNQLALERAVFGQVIPWSQVPALCACRATLNDAPPGPPEALSGHVSGGTLDAKAGA